MTSYLDTHNHVGLTDLKEDLDDLGQKCREAGIRAGVITTGTVGDFERVSEVARKLHWGYCVGLHPLYIREDYQADLQYLKEFLLAHLDDEHLVGIGEIGLDFYVEGLDRSNQEKAFEAQLQLAQIFNLAVSVHSRRALYRVMALMARYPKVQAALHAFSGSQEEMRQVIKRGYYVGFGGAMTYSGSKRVRQAAFVCPEDKILLETDSPDMSPSFSETGHSSPLFLPRYLKELALLRKVTPELLGQRIFENSLNAFPRMKKLIFH